MTDQGARCPQCQVTFRVSPAQLQAAGGRVRCGFCLAVFDARANPIALGDEAPVEPPPWLRAPDQWHPDDGFHRARLAELLGPLPDAPFAAPAAPPASAPAGDPGGDPLPPPWAPLAPRPRRGARVAGAAILLAGTLALALQVLYFRADPLAADPRFEPLYRTWCAALPCPPAASGHRQGDGFRVEQAVVRPLPPDGLRLDAMLVNGGSRRLPLPAIRILFEDLDAQPVAARALTPSQYLAPGAAAELDAGHRLHLVLDLYDPGPAAVGYRVEPLQ